MKAALLSALVLGAATLPADAAGAAARPAPRVVAFKALRRSACPTRRRAGSTP